MRIENIYIEKYGCLNQLNLDLEDGFQVLKGFNEEGKTTLLAFIRGVFFGFKHSLTHLKLGNTAPFYTEGMGGRIKIRAEIASKERYFEFIRNTKGTQDGTLSIRDIDSNQLREGGLAESLRDNILGGVDKTLFNSVFVLTVEDLNNLKTLTKDEVAHALFSADSGIGLALPRELTAMKDEMKLLWNPDNSRGSQKHRILKKEITVLEKKKREIDNLMKNLSGQRGNRKKKTEKIDKLRETRSNLVTDVKVASDRIKARNYTTQIEKLNNQIRELPKGPFPTNLDAKELATLRENIFKCKAEVTIIKDKIKSDTTFQSKLNLDTDAEGNCVILEGVRQSDLIEKIENVKSANKLRVEMKDLSNLVIKDDLSTRLDTITSTLQRVTKDLEELESIESIDKVSIDQNEKDILPSAILYEIDEALIEKISRTKGPLEESVAEVKRIQTDLNDALASEGGFDIKAFEAIPLDTASISRLRAELSDSATIQRSRFSGFLNLIALSAFIFGLAIILILDEILGGGGMVIIGLLILILGRFENQGVDEGPELSSSTVKQLKKWGLSSNARATDLDQIVSNLVEARKLSEELGKAKSLLDQRERHYSEGFKMLHRLINECKLEIPEGASAANLEGNLKELATKSRSSTVTVDLLKSNIIKSDTKKKILIKEQKKNEKLLNKIFNELGVDNLESVNELLTEIERRSEIETELKRLESAEEIVNQVFKEVEKACLSVKEEAPILDNLSQVYSVQSDRAKKAVSVRDSYNEYGRKIAENLPILNRWKTELSSYDKKAMELLKHFTLDSDEDMESAVKDGEFLSTLNNDLDNEQKKIDNLNDNWPDFQKGLDDNDLRDDESILLEQKQRDTDLGNSINTLQNELDILNAELLNLDESSDLTEILADISSKEAELKEVEIRWANLFLVQFIIQRTREEYEGDHGSEVLRRASEHLNRITNGRYTQIMRIDEVPGYQLKEYSGTYRSPIPPDVSRGAFAQIYLSIRLAYAEKGTHSNLPIILDDAFEGFDDERVIPALSILSEIGLKRQVLLFSHHGYICESAKSLGASVIELRSSINS